MFKPEEFLPREAWRFVLSKLSTEDELSCRCVCKSFKKEVDSILKNNQDRLWLRHRDDQYGHYFCYDKDHTISSRDTLYFGKTISIKNLEFVSSLMTSLKILQLDPLDQVHRDDYDEDDDFYYDVGLPDYRDKNNKAVPITKIFPQVACLILPGGTENKNFVGDLSQVKHLTLFDAIHEELPTFPNLDSLEMRKYSSEFGERLPMPSKRFIAQHATIQWKTLLKTLEVIETGLNCKGYISVGKPHFENLKILKNHFTGIYGQNENLDTLINFLKDHKGSLTELSFSAGKEVANLKVLLPLLTNLHKLSVKIETDKQAIEFKEIKALTYNLQYFELSFSLWSGTKEHLDPILENLPTGLDNLSMEEVQGYGDIDSFVEKIVEKVVNGDTKRVTIAGVDDGYTKSMIEKIVKMKPSPVKVEERNTRVFEGDHSDSGNRTDYSRSICDIVVSL